MIKLLLKNPESGSYSNILKLMLLACALFFYSTAFPQAPINDECTGALPLTVGTTAACTGLTGNVSEATESPSPGGNCTGTSDDDIWYSFVATSAYHVIKVTPSESFDPVIQLFSGACGSLTMIGSKCGNETKTGQEEKLGWKQLNIGETYYVRVYHFGAHKPATPDFEICVFQPDAPANDNCANALNIPVNGTCMNQVYDTEGATDSGIPESCMNTLNPDDDIWFKFTSPASGKTIIRVDGSNDFRPVIEVFDGCGGSTIACANGIGHNVIMKLELTGLTPGNVYYYRVYDYYGPDFSPKTTWFVMCLMDPPAPANDDCSNAISLDGTGQNNYLAQTLNGATASTGHPAVCTGNANDDMWYKFTAKSTKQVVDLLPSSGHNGLFQVLTGCDAAATVVQCADLDAEVGDREMIKLTGLTANSVYYVRVFSHETAVPPTTSFDIAAYSVPNHDDCEMAREIIVSPTGNILTDSVTNATESMTACDGGSADDDVWFKFKASAVDNFIVVESSEGFDAKVQLFSGVCGSLTSMVCKNDSSAGQIEKIEPTTLVVNDYYYVRVFDNNTGVAATRDFNIYVRGSQIQSTNKAVVENSLKVYPVPAAGNVTVSFTTPSVSDIQIRVIDTNGKPVYSNNMGTRSGDVTENIQLNNLTQGMYLLQISLGNEMIGKKIIVE